MKLVPITEKQKQLLLFLYKFRFLTTNQLQELFHHSTIHRIHPWLKDLREKEYITIVKTSNAVIDKNKPYIYHLLPKAIHVLKQYSTCYEIILKKVYSEHERQQSFIDHCLTVANIFLLFEKQKKEDDLLYFFTQSDMAAEGLPENKPSAYMVLKRGDTAKRYFIELFYPYATSGVLRHRFRSYLEYASGGDWEANAGDKPFPHVLFICPTKRLRNHLLHYGKNVFKKYEEAFQAFVATKAGLLQGTESIVWQKVVTPEDGE